MTLCHCFIIIMYKHTMHTLVRMGIMYILHVMFKTRNNLFKRLFVNRHFGGTCIKMSFINTFCKNTNKRPSAYSSSNLLYKSLAFIICQMDIRIRFLVIFTGLAHEI